MALTQTTDWNVDAFRPAKTQAADRVAFVDYGKGFCIVLVVMMHSTLGVGNAMGGEGWLHYAVDFSKPFRMPDFFLIAGLFLARTIDAPVRRYFDRKVLHFAYFYVLWSFILITTKAGPSLPTAPLDVLKDLALATVEPPSTLWFIYLPPVSFVITRLTKNIPWPFMLAAGVALESLRINGGGTLWIEFTARFVYFYAGYRFAPQIFAFVAWITRRPALALAGIGLWFAANGAAVFGLSIGDAPLAAAPGLSIVFGFAGALALIAVSALLAECRLFGVVGWIGARSLIVYLAFFLFMAAARIVLVGTGLISDIGTVSALVTVAGIAGPLILAAAVGQTPLKYLFERPGWARLKNA